MVNEPFQVFDITDMRHVAGEFNFSQDFSEVSWLIELAQGVGEGSNLGFGKLIPRLTIPEDVQCGVDRVGGSSPFAHCAELLPQPWALASCLHHPGTKPSQEVEGSTHYDNKDEDHVHWAHSPFVPFLLYESLSILARHSLSARRQQDG